MAAESIFTRGPLDHKSEVLGLIPIRANPNRDPSRAAVSIIGNNGFWTIRITDYLFCINANGELTF